MRNRYVTVESMALVPRNVFLEPRCRVCRNDLVRKKVNDMLAAGSGYAFIVRALGEDNANCDRRDLVTIDSVRNHCERHFPVQQVARATYRDILERRAQENQIDFVKGVATALLPVTFFEVAMNKAFRSPGRRSHRGQCGHRLASRREASVRPRRG